MARKRAAKRRRVWRDWTPRQPTGEDGALQSEYPRVTVRVPPDVLSLLERVAERQNRPQWRVLADAIRAYALAQGVG